MKYFRRGSVWLLLVACYFAALLSCSGVPVVCTVTPIDIEELRADSRDFDVELAQVRGRLAKAQADLASWQTRVDSTRLKPPALRADLERVKKMSGVTKKSKRRHKPVRFRQTGSRHIMKRLLTALAIGITAMSWSVLVGGCGGSKTQKVDV